MAITRTLKTKAWVETINGTVEDYFGNPAISFDTSDIPSGYIATAATFTIRFGGFSNKAATLYALRSPVSGSAPGYYSDASLAGHTFTRGSNTIVLGGKYLRYAASNGIQIIASSGNVAFDGPYIRDATLAVTLIQDAVTPTIYAPTGSLTKGATYTFAWTNNLNSADGSISAVKVSTAPVDAPDSAVTTTYSANTTSVQMTVPVAGTTNASTGMMWRVCIVSGTGTETWNAWQRHTYVSPSLSIGDLWPTGTIYQGFATRFRWALAASLPNGAVSIGVDQASAQLQYRADGALDYSTVNVDGSANYCTVPAGTLPAGGFDWRVVVTATTGDTVTSSWTKCTNAAVAVSVTDLVPGEGARVIAVLDHRFSWSISTDPPVDELPGDATQARAILYWRSTAATSWTSVAVTGSDQYVDIPAGTFTGMRGILWYVSVTTSLGSTAVSDTIELTTEDALSTCVAVSPVGGFFDNRNAGITFIWQHINDTGTRQYGYQLELSQDNGVNWATLSAADTETSQWTSAVAQFANGTYYWRVRTKNSDGAWGGYSAIAAFGVRQAPDTPVISRQDGKPLLTINWQSSGQTGYEIEVDGRSSGILYGADKTWTSPELLADGRHTVRLRIVNQYRDLSAWASLTVLIANDPSGSVTLRVTPEWAQVSAAWTLTGSFSFLYLLRDGAIVAKAPVSDALTALIDRTSVGKGDYMLRAFDANGYYTDSNVVAAAPILPYAAIGLRHGTGWDLLKYSTTPSRYARQNTQAGAMVQYFGDALPHWEASGYQTVTHTIQYLKPQGKQLDRLLSFIGQQVIYKDAEGHLATGIFNALPISADGFGRHSFSISIQETEQEALTYGD